MSEKNVQPSLDSDDSDEDYIPDDKTGNVSEEADSGDAESEIEDNEVAPKSKRRRKSDKNDESEDVKKEESDLDVDAIWADFKKETNVLYKTASGPEKSQPSVNPSRPSNPPSKVGTSRGGGLAGILGKIGKKDKLSTLEKSRLDWNNFKKAEGIEEEIKIHNKGKDGFLEKRDFLERTDLRQFEIEKAMRSVKRSNR